MTYSEQDLLGAKRQIDSTLHKLHETVRTLEGKENAARCKSRSLWPNAVSRPLPSPFSSLSGSWNRHRSNQAPGASVYCRSAGRLLFQSSKLPCLDAAL